MHERGQLVGKTTELTRALVKSMRVEALQVANLTPTGIEGDRRYAFAKDGADPSFPWLTGRDFPGMVLFTPSMDLETGSVQVELPDGRKLALESDALREVLQEGATRRPRIHLVYSEKGIFDNYPISLMGSHTIRAVGVRSRVQGVDARRFRPNIVVDPLVKKEGAEEKWIGGILTFGDRADSPQIQVVGPDQRCMMININPDDASRTPEILRDVTRNRRQEMGVYAKVRRAGEMTVGEPVYFSRTT